MDDEAAPDAGAAYVFQRLGGVWTQHSKLTSALSGHFGSSVALSGTSVAVGTPDLGGGQVHLFDDVGGVWVESAILVGSDTLAGDLFGSSTDLDGDVLMVGAYENDVAGMRAGAVYTYGRSAGAWQQVAQFIAADAEAFATLGRDVSVSGDRAVTGAFGSNVAIAGGGAAYALDRTPLTPFLPLLPPPAPDPVPDPGPDPVPDPGLDPAWYQVYCLCASDAPCGNEDAEAGCANSTGAGARLDALGSPSIEADDMLLSVTGLPSRSRGVLFMGSPRDELKPFRGGQLCVEGRKVKHYRWSSADGSGSMLLGPGLVERSQQGDDGDDDDGDDDDGDDDDDADDADDADDHHATILAGDTWAFQVAYRDKSKGSRSPCHRHGRGGWNTTNAIVVTFTP